MTINDIEPQNTADSKISDEQGGERLDEPRHERMYFAQDGKKRPPFGFVNFDLAINQLGMSRLPLEWPLMVQNSDFPYRYNPLRDEFMTYSYQKRAPYQTLYEDVEFSSAQDADRAKIYSEKYKVIVEELTMAIQSGALRAFIIFIDGSMPELINTAILTTQFTRAYYTGTLIVTADGEKTRVRPLFKIGDFDSWLHSLDGPVKREMVPAVDQDLIKVVPQFVKAVRDAECLLTAQGAYSIFKEACDQRGIRMSTTGFERKLWKNPALNAVRKNGKGRLSAKDRAKFDSSRQAFLAVLLENLPDKRAHSGEHGAGF